MNNFLIGFLFFSFLFHINKNLKNIYDESDLIFELLKNEDMSRNKRDIYVLDEKKHLNYAKKEEIPVENKEKKQQITDNEGLDSDNLQNYAINNNNDINYDSDTSYGSFNLADALDDNQNLEILSNNDIDTSKTEESSMFDTTLGVDEDILKPTYYHGLKNNGLQTQNINMIKNQEEFDNSHSIVHTQGENINQNSQESLSLNKNAGLSGVSGSNVVSMLDGNQDLIELSDSHKVAGLTMSNHKANSQSINPQSQISQFSMYGQKIKNVVNKPLIFKQNSPYDARYKQYQTGNKNYGMKTNNLFINTQSGSNQKQAALKESSMNAGFIAHQNNQKTVSPDLTNLNDNTNGYDETVVEVVLDCTSCGETCPESCNDNQNYFNITNINILSRHCCANNMIENTKKCPPCAFIDTSDCPAAATEFDKFNEMYFILEIGLREPFKPEMNDKSSESFQKIRKICQDFILRVYHDHPYYHETLVSSIKNSKDYSIASMLLRFTKSNVGNISPLYKAIMCKCGCDIFYIDLFFKLQPANTTDIVPFCPPYCFINTPTECTSNTDCHGCCSNTSPMSFFLQKAPNVPPIMPTLPVMNMGMFNPILSQALCPNHCHDSCYPFCSEECCLNSQGYKRTLRSKIYKPSYDDV